MRPGRARAAAGLALLGALHVAWGALYVQRTSLVLDGERLFVLWDDAMISMRYAANLAQGAGLRWNPGEPPVQGFSNPAITLAMAALHRLPFGAGSLCLAVQLLNLAGLALLPWLAWRLAKDGFEGDPWIASATAIATALCAPLAIWGLQGADTTAVALWLFAALSLLARALARGAPWPRALFPLLALGLLIRLDTAIYGVVFAGLAAWYPGGSPLRRLAAGAACYGLVLAGFLAASQAYYGDPLPNTFYLKATGMPLVSMVAFGVRRLVGFWYTALPALLFAGAAAWRFRRRPLVAASAGLVLVAFAYDVRVGSDWAAEHGSRFTAPVLPLLCMLCCAGGLSLLRERRPALMQHAAGRLAAVLCLLVFCSYASPPLARAEWLDPRAPTMYRDDNLRNARLGLYLRDHSAEDTRIAVHWAGLAPYLSRRPAIDVLGKSDRHIARLAVDRFLPGHSKWDWRYVLEERRPDVFLTTSRGLDRIPWFRKHYLLMESDGVRMFVRRDAVARIRDPAARFQPLPTDDAAPAR